MRQPGVLLLGNAGRANLLAHHAELNDAHYLVKVQSDWQHPNPTTVDKNFTGYAHGSAHLIKQINKHQLQLSDATYTTCPPSGNTWSLSASQITLDKKTAMGSSLNNVFSIYGIPVFYLPYFSFPLNNARKSGFLYPTITPDGAAGPSFSLPYYFNLAPNYDDTLTPTWYTKHGLYLNNIFRYLTKNSSGQLTINWMPYDKSIGSTRHSTNFNNQTIINQHWRTHLIYNSISDPNFISNFSSNNSTDTDETILPRSASVNYNGSHWNFSGIMQDYLIVKPILTIENRPYNLLPQLTLEANYPDLYHHINFSLNTQLTEFQKSSTSPTEQAIEGQRLNIAPTISLPARWSFGYIQPQLTFDSTLYQLQNRSQDTPNRNYPHKTVWRNLPIVSIDSGLYFDRRFFINQQLYTQTLEPRLYYLYVPYKNQSDIPPFDTSLISFNADSLFSSNRFSGLDRIGDANQITAALTTHINNAQGLEKLDASLGQIFYFNSRRVSLCRDTPNNPNCLNNEDPDHLNNRSDIVGSFGYYFNHNWNLSAMSSYSNSKNELSLQNYQFQYIADPRHIFNIGYQENLRDYALLSRQEILDGTKPPKLSQLTTSILWQLTPKWSIIGKWNYSLNLSRTIDTFGGLQYDSCCWAIRVFMQHYIKSEDPDNPQNLDGPGTNSIMLQFQLKGLGGTNPNQISGLVSQVPGYNPQQSGF